MTAGKNIATSANNTKDRGEYMFSKKFVSATGTFKKNSQELFGFSSCNQLKNKIQTSISHEQFMGVALVSMGIF